MLYRYFTRPTIPRPTVSDLEAERFANRHRATQPREIWAELATVEAELASRIFQRKRPRLIWGDPPVTDREWLEKRARGSGPR